MKLHYLIGNKDYGPGIHTATFFNGMTVTSFDITILNDNDYEDRKTFDVVIIGNRLPNHVSVGSIRVAEVAIIDISKSIMHKMYLYINVTISL